MSDTVGNPVLLVMQLKCDTGLTIPEGYKTFLMLISAEGEISVLH